MTDRFIDRYAGRLPDDGAAESASVTVDEAGYLGYLRGVKERAIMLELRKKDGCALAVGYGWIERMEYEPSRITLTLGGRTIRIHGRRLNSDIRPGLRLFEGLTRHRICWIQEAGRADELRAEDDATVIERIEW